MDGGSIGATLVRETGRALSRGAARLGAAWARVNGVTAVRGQNLRLRPARLPIHPIVRGVLERAGVDLDLYAHEWLTNETFTGALWPHAADIPAFTIRMWDHRLATTVSITDTITLDARYPGHDVLTLTGIDLPESVIDLLPGRPLDDLMESEFTRGLGLVVKRVERSERPTATDLRIHLHATPWVSVGSLRRGAVIAARRPARRRVVYDINLGNS